MRIRTKLIAAFLSLSIVLVTGTGIIAYSVASNALTESYLQHLKSVAQLIHHRIDTFIGHQNAVFELTGNRLGLQNSLARYIKSPTNVNRESLAESLLSLKSSITNVRGIDLAGLDGRIISSTNEIAIGTLFNNKEIMARSILANVIDVSLTEPDRSPHITISGPVYVADKTEAILILHLDLYELSSLVNDYTGLGKTGEIVLAKRDMNGNALYITPLRLDDRTAMVRTADKNLLNLPINQALQETETVLRNSVDYRGQEVFAITGYVPETGWGLVVKIDKAEALAPVNDLGILLIIISSIFIIIAALVASYLAHLISRPIVVLSNIATRIASGDLSQRARIIPKDETGVLAKAFNLMADNLVNANADLEAKIGERTGELEIANQQLHTELALRRQAEAAAQVEHYKLETVTANLGAGLAIIDKEYHITWMNEAIHNMFGGKVGEFCYSSFHGETHVCNGCGISDVFKGKTERSAHELLETSSGRTAWYEIIATPIKDRKGNITGMLDMVIPITERKLMEQRLQMSSKLASIGALASGVAHEINNPMTAVIGYAQLLMDNKDLPAEVKEDLEKINSQGRRVAKIIQNLLVFARKYKPEKMDVDINELIQGTLDLRRYELRTGNITVNTSLASGLPEITVDRHQVQQVMLNLIVNAEYAIRTAKRNGIITIETRRKNGSIAISIADNGSGISPGNLARIFDPFFTTKDVGEGTGMGLAVSYGIVAEHNGIIYAESVEGDGSTFTVELPVKPSQALVAESAVETSKTTPVNTRKGKILIVEDEAAIQDIIVRILTIRGHQADTASSGNEALGRISESEYDLYLLDLKMPGMDGQDLFEILKQNKPLSAQKVIFITGDTVTGDTQDFLESTGRPYVNKPFTPADLLAAVDKALG